MINMCVAEEVASHITSPWQRQLSSRGLLAMLVEVWLKTIATLKPFQPQLTDILVHLDPMLQLDCKYREKEGASGSSHFE